MWAEHTGVVQTQRTTIMVLGAVWAVYLLGGWLVGAVPRWRPIRAEPATPNLPAGPPPAVVNYLIHHGTTTADAPIGTLIDLAARGHLEFYQPGSDSEQVMIRERSRDRGHLTPYERSVMNRVVEAAGEDDWVPLADLSVHYAEHGYLWSVQFGRDVAADARQRGLAVARDGGAQAMSVAIGILLSLVTGCLMPASVVGVVAGPDAEQVGAAGGIAFLAGTGLSMLLLITACLYLNIRWYSGERLTRQGRAVAAQWLGVAHWLRAHKGLADLPTASVTVWDRYLAYGAALGLTSVVSDVVDLTVGDRTTLWSTYTGTPRPIRVRYRRRGRGIGYPPSAVIVFGLFWLAAVAGGAYTVARWHERIGPLASAALALLSALLAGRALYRIARALLDLVRPIEMTGLVVSRSTFPWNIYLEEMGRDADTPPPFFSTPMSGQLRYYLVVDDGRADAAPLWTVRFASGHPRECHEGDIVRLSGYRWCRTVRDITVLTPGPRSRSRSKHVAARGRRARNRA